MQIGPNTYATVSYRLSDAAGALLEDSEKGEPITYVHGYGMLVPGLEAGLVGMAAGERKLIVVAPEEGFGVRDEELVFSISRSQLPATDTIEAGDFIVAEDSDGDEADLRVVAVHDDHVVVDANHELAGKTLHFAVEVQSVRQATEAEVAAAASGADDDSEGDSDAAPAPHPELDEAMREALQALGGKRNLPN